jgi:hypothetical protein
LIQWLKLNDEIPPRQPNKSHKATINPCIKMHNTISCLAQLHWKDHGQAHILSVLVIIIAGENQLDAAIMPEVACKELENSHENVV